MALLRLNNFSERDLDLTLSYGAGLMLNQKLNSSHYVANGYACQKIRYSKICNSEKPQGFCAQRPKGTEYSQAPSQARS